MAASSSSTRRRPKIPARGDKVVDKSRLVHPLGAIIGFTYDHSDPKEEVIESIAVRYSMAKTGVQWYTAEQFSPEHWNGQRWEIGEEKQDEVA